MTKVTKSERKPMSKRRRFEVFKRDGFQCQYCGATPPAVVLEVDHIVPLFLGGTERIDNLVSACFACNRGKAEKSLSDVPASLLEKSELVKEKESQLTSYCKIMKKKQARVDADAKTIGELYKELNPGFKLTEKGIESVKTFVEKIDVFEVSNALRHASRKADIDDTFKYFCGICWRIIRQNGEYHG